MNSTQRSIAGTFLIIISTLCLAFIFSSALESAGWMDFTSNSRYTLSDGTKKVLAKVTRPLQARLYYSRTAVESIGTDQLLQYNRAYHFTRDLLRAYDRESGGKVEFLEFDPTSYSDEADEAKELGLQSFQLTGDHLFFFGLAVTSDTGVKEVIRFIEANEESVFEYKITKMVERASRPSKKKVGILSSLPVLGSTDSPEMQRLKQMRGEQAAPSWNIVEALKMDYDLAAIETSATEIPADIDFLMLIHPKGFGDEILYAVDQFVLRGGKLLAFLDPYCSVDQPPPGGRNAMMAQYTHVRKSDLNRLTTSWGIKMSGERIIGDRDLAITQGSKSMLPAPEFGRKKSCFPGSEVITASLENNARLVMLYAGALRKVDGTEVNVIPIIQTTAAGGTRKFGNMDAMQSQRDPGSLWAKESAANPGGFKPEGSSLLAAVRITGKVTSAFPDGKPGDAIPPAEDPEGTDNKDENKVEHLKHGDDVSVVIVSDVDFISNAVVVHPHQLFVNPIQKKYSNTSSAFLLNALDFLGGSSDLISVRSRGDSRREFDYIKAIEKEAANQTQAKVDQINSEIKNYQDDLSKLQEQATKKTVGLLRDQALKQEQEAQRNIRAKQRELREVKREAREEVEAVKATAQFIDILGMPLLVIVIALGLWFMRSTKRTQKMREDMA